MKKTFKLITTWVLAAIMVISATGCGGEIKKAESAVNGMFTAVKEADFEKIYEFIDSDEKDMDFASKTEETKEVVKLLFEKLEYKIISSEKREGDEVVVKTEITTRDMKPVFEQFYTKALEYAFAHAFDDDEKVSEEEMEKTAMGLLKDAILEADKVYTTNVDVEVEKKDDGTWKVDMEDDLLDALLGGAYKALEEMEDKEDK